MTHHCKPKLLYQIIKELGLTSNLNVVLDVADPRSYDGSSQTWTDATGNGYNFFRGVDVSATATDPTFNGTANVWRDTTYFSFDGGDTMKQTAAHNFSDAWHKNNGACTLLAVYYPVGKAANSSIWMNNGDNNGVGFSVLSTRVLRFGHSTSNVPATEGFNTTATVTSATWNFIAAAFDEATTTLDMHVNSTVEAKVPAASTATNSLVGVMRLSGTDDTPTSGLESTERLACFAAWSTKVSSANVQAIYTALKTRRFTTFP